MSYSKAKIDRRRLSRRQKQKGRRTLNRRSRRRKDRSSKIRPELFFALFVEFLVALCVGIALKVLGL